MGLDFWPWKFQWVKHNFVEFQRRNFNLSGISKGKVTDLKIPGQGSFLKKYVPPPLSLNQIFPLDADTYKGLFSLYLYKFWQDKLSDFLRRDSSSLLPSGSHYSSLFLLNFIVSSF